MSEIAVTCLPPLLKGDAEVIKSRPVGIETLVVCPENSDELRRVVQSLPQFHFLLPMPLFGDSTLRYIHDCADGFLVPVCVLYGMRKTMNVFYGTIRHEQPMFKVKVASRLPRLLKNGL